MTRIFLPLVFLHFVGLVAGVTTGVVYGTSRDIASAQRSLANVLQWDWFSVHFLCGLAVAVLTLFVHCLVFTYFLGTGRWVKEVAYAYGLPDQPWPKRTRELKRQAFPPALLAMLLTIVLVASGAAAQVGAWPWWIHLGLAGAAVLANFFAWTVEYRAISENIVVLDRVMAEVQRLASTSNDDNDDTPT